MDCGSFLYRIKPPRPLSVEDLRIFVDLIIAIIHFSSAQPQHHSRPQPRSPSNKGLKKEVLQGGLNYHSIPVASAIHCRNSRFVKSFFRHAHSLCIFLSPFLTFGFIHPSFFSSHAQHSSREKSFLALSSISL